MLLVAFSTLEEIEGEERVSTLEETEGEERVLYLQSKLRRSEGCNVFEL
jgi:hypothetical protein